MAVPLHFTIEFLGFLVLAGGAVLVLSRPGLVPGGTFNRIVAATGFAALATAQAAHGGSFVPEVRADGTELLLAARALGFTFVLLGLAGGIRPAAVAAAGIQLEESLALAPAGAAALLGLTSFGMSARGEGRALRRLGISALLLGAAEVLTGISPSAEFGTRAVDGAALAAHVIRALGYAAMGAWLWTGVRSSIRTRFVASFVSLLVIVVLALSSALTGVISENVQDEELKRVGGQLANAIGNIETAQRNEIAKDVRQIAGLDEVRDRIVTKGDLTSLASAYLTADIWTMDFILFTDSRGGLLARAGNGPSIEDAAGRTKVTVLRGLDALKITGLDVVESVIDPTFAEAAAPQSLGDAAALVGAAEVADPIRVSRTIGAVVIGKWIDAFTVENVSSNLAPAKASLLIGDKLIASFIKGRVTPNELVPGSLRSDLETSGQVADELVVNSRSFNSAVGFIEGPDGPVATLVLSSPARIVAQTREDVTRTLFIVAMGVGGIVLLLAWLSGRRITRPIQVLTETARRVREGDLKAQAPVAGEDEVGQLGETFNEMTTALFRMTNDLRRAAREEHDLRARIETIIESMADGLVAVNADGTILAFNREAEQLTGMAADDARGRPVQEVLDARDPHGNAVSLPIFELVEGSVGGVFLHREDGDPVPVAVTSAALRDEEGEIAGGVAVVRDMTREREVERMKSEFLSNISHELRTPLTPIKGYAEILGRKDVPPAKIRQFTQGILDSTTRLERIVELLVDFSALEAGRLSPKTTPVDLAAMLTRLAEEWKRRTPRHKIVMDLKARLPKVIGDERLLRRSLEEVMDNAIKFSPRGGTIRLEAKGVSKQNGGAGRRAVAVTISDQGIGIPPEDLQKIFSDFHQLDGSETRSYGGLGLGLTFVHRIVEAHDGSVSVTSEPDQGTSFTISIPAVRSRKASPR